MANVHKSPRADVSVPEERTPSARAAHEPASVRDSAAEDFPPETAEPSAWQTRFGRISDQVFVDLLAAGNVVLFVGAAVVAKVVYLQLVLGQVGGSQPYLSVAFFGALAVFFEIKRQRLYEPDRLCEHGIPGAGILGAVVVGFVVLLAIGYLLKQSQFYSRGWVLVWFSLSPVLLTGWYAVSQRVFRALSARGHLNQRVAIIRVGGYAEDLASRIATNPRFKLSLSFVSEVSASGTQLEDRAGLDRFVAIAQKLDVDNVIVAVPFDYPAAIADVVDRLAFLPAKLTVYSDLLSERLGHLAIADFSNLRLLEVQAKPLSPWSQLAKSAFDRIVAAILIVVLAPLMAAAAVAIKLETPGPILFRQRRHGYNHREIDVLKFRTMTVAEDGETVRQATRDDQRITRVGRFLRRTSIDELPQLFNVVAGTMSLVGPRPHAIVHNHFYGDVVERYANRHRVKPGMTGWAQINGFRGGTEDSELMRQRIEHDLHYIDNWSFWFDLRILLMTPLALLSGNNAY